MSVWDDLGHNDKQSATGEQRQRIMSKLRVLCEIHGKKLSPEAEAHWVKQLGPYAAGQGLYRVLDAGCNERSMPSIAWVLETLQNTARQDTKPYVEPTPLTEAERKRSDNAAVLSMLWLHYAQGWDLEQVGAHTLARVFASTSGKTDVVAVLAAAKEVYTREIVLKWMDDQQRAGN